MSLICVLPQEDLKKTSKHMEALIHPYLSVANNNSKVGKPRRVCNSVIEYLNRSQLGLRRHVGYLCKLHNSERCPSLYIIKMFKTI